MKKLSDEQIKNIIELYNNGTAPKEIGEKFGIANNSVTRLLRNHGVQRNQLIRVSQEKIDLMLNQYENHISFAQIAINLDIDESTVFRILRKNNAFNK